MAIKLTFSTNDPQIRKNTEQLSELLRDLYSSEAEITKLIEAGVDIKARDENDQTALHWAAFFGRTEIFPLLLERGADTEARDENDQTALHKAALHGRTEIVRLLLERGADTEAKNANNGYTALHWAARSGHTETARLLLERGANIWAKRKNGNTALDSSRDAIKALINGHIAKWKPQYEAFLKHEFTPQTPADWLGVASVMPVSDPQEYSSVADRVAQLMDWHKGLQALRSQAASPTIGGLEV